MKRIAVYSVGVSIFIVVFCALVFCLNSLQSSVEGVQKGSAEVNYTKDEPCAACGENIRDKGFAPTIYHSISCYPDGMLSQASGYAFMCKECWDKSTPMERIRVCLKELDKACEEEWKKGDLGDLNLKRSIIEGNLFKAAYGKRQIHGRSPDSLNTPLIKFKKGEFKDWFEDADLEELQNFYSNERWPHRRIPK
jgi:hypothetical protein